MIPLPDNPEKKTDDSLFKRPTGILLDEKEWLYLKKRYHMTTRELQVAILVCRGFNNEGIGKALKVKHGTVKTHLRNIYRRVRVRSKVTLLLRFIEDINKYYVPSKADKEAIPIIERPPKPELPSKTSEKK